MGGERWEGARAALSYSPPNPNPLKKFGVYDDDNRGVRVEDPRKMWSPAPGDVAKMRPSRFHTWFNVYLGQVREAFSSDEALSSLSPSIFVVVLDSLHTVHTGA